MCGAFFEFCPCCSSLTGSLRFDSLLEGERSTVDGQPLHRNLNMMSAFTHIVGDTLRTVAIFLAALVSSATHIPGDVCDAWAALVVSLSVLVLCGSLVFSICSVARSMFSEQALQYKRRTPSYLRLSEEETDDDDDDEIR